MRFTDNLKSLTIETNVAASVTEPSYTADYVDTEQTRTLHGDSVGALTNTTAVTVVGALPAGTLVRDIKSVTVFNRDTTAKTITVKKVNNGTGYTVAKMTLQAGESMVYDGARWNVYTAAGELKTNTLSATTSSPGAKNGATVTATEGGAGVVHQTTLTFAATPITVRDTQQGGGVKVYDFPEGRILVLGATGSIALTTTSDPAATLNAGVTCNWGIGTTTQASATLATTEQDIVQVANVTSSAVVNVPGAASNAAGVLAVWDGTVTAKDAYLNVAVATGTDVDADATVTVNGQVTITWINLGDL
jgi:hypothetical protein